MGQVILPGRRDTGGFKKDEYRRLLSTRKSAAGVRAILVKAGIIYDDVTWVGRWVDRDANPNVSKLLVASSPIQGDAMVDVWTKPLAEDRKLPGNPFAIAAAARTTWVDTGIDLPASGLLVFVNQNSPVTETGAFPPVPVEDVTTSELNVFGWPGSKAAGDALVLKKIGSRIWAKGGSNLFPGGTTNPAQVSGRINFEVFHRGARPSKTRYLVTFPSGQNVGKFIELPATIPATPVAYDQLQVAVAGRIGPDIVADALQSLEEASPGDLPDVTNSFEF